MQSYKLFIDDERDNELFYPGINFKIARNYYEGVALIEEFGIPEFIAFDHDLGNTEVPEKTGHTFAKYIVEYMMDNNICTAFRYNVHSSNPEGAKNIDMLLKNFFKVHCV